MLTSQGSAAESDSRGLHIGVEIAYSRLPMFAASPKDRGPMCVDGVSKRSSPGRSSGCVWKSCN